MKRLQRVLVEIFAIAGIWLLWDLRMALTLFILLCVFEAFRSEPERRDPLPTLTDRAP